MRFIFITLLLANIAFVAWHVLNDDAVSGAPAAVTHKQSGFKLVLLEELSAKQAGDLGVERKLLGMQSLTPSGGQSATSNKCVILGPFANKQAARKVVDELLRLSVSSSVESMAFPAGVGHWVYLPPTKTRREALKMLSVLQERKIDSYVVPKGDNKNAISLGMFTKESLADGQLNRIKALGFDAKLKVVERTYNELWVMLNHQEDDKITSSQWVALLKDKKSVKKRKNFCLGVALR